MFASRLEIIPTQDIVPAVLERVPAGTTITVTCLPQHGVERTMDTASALAGHGFNVVPHLAARSISSRGQLAGILRACGTAGITELFVIGGDKGQSGGPFESSEDLMREIAQLSGKSMKMGVAGYPEGHPSIADGQLMESLRIKQDLATHIVTQMCFSPSTIAEYMAVLRRDGVKLPVWAGVAGAVPRTKLLRLATKIGVGSSLRFITGKGALGMTLLGGTSYQPEQFIADLADLPVPPAGIHLYTFNSLDSLPEAGGLGPIHGTSDGAGAKGGVRSSAVPSP
ncbi:methylenetetrahydrofolate reductase [Arthrobacter glacialis]|uniref:Methylenetetrahydrofolate reductase n=1 Tax=Arthrobacter glacialis TaxID=1664 RepID=A0A2S3ZT80_ARTGL|nr:methylenetetrahydrofolate reductase [Arthrobacter glacialis]POH72067.1 methylenetetrahydrofolate reductase [Arthrobacter glacialis]